jgi:hypothetical protein
MYSLTIAWSGNTSRCVCSPPKGICTCDSPGAGVEHFANISEIEVTIEETPASVTVSVTRDGTPQITTTVHPAYMHDINCTEDEHADVQVTLPN